MSASARRLTGNVRTGRFRWQSARPDEIELQAEHAAPSPGIASSHPQHQHLVDAHELTLPSAAAERTRRIEREAFEKGFAEAERVCEAAASARVDPIIERLISTIDEVASLRSGMLRRTERDLVRLAIAMAERIVHRQLDRDRGLLAEMARKAIAQLGDNAVASIHLHPDDFEATTAGRDAGVGSPISIVADPSIKRGGCRVNSVFGTIDLSVDAQIHELSRTLLGDDPGKDAADDVLTDA